MIFIRKMKNLLGSVLIKLADFIDPQLDNVYRHPGDTWRGSHQAIEDNQTIENSESRELNKLNKINEIISFKFPNCEYNSDLKIWSFKFDISNVSSSLDYFNRESDIYRNIRKSIDQVKSIYDVDFKWSNSESNVPNVINTKWDIQFFPNDDEI